MKKVASTSSFSRRQLASSSSTPTFSTTTSFQQQTGSCTRYKKPRPATACASYSTLTTGRPRAKQLTERPGTADQRLVWSGRECSKRANARSGLSLAVGVGTRHTSYDVKITQLSPSGVDARHSCSPVSYSDSLLIDNDDGCSSSSSEIGYDSFRPPTKSVFPVTLLKSRYVNGGGILFSGMSQEARAAYEQMKQELLTSCHSNDDEHPTTDANERSLTVEPRRRHRSSKSQQSKHIHCSNSASDYLPPSSSGLGLAVPEIRRETVATCISDDSLKPSTSGKQCWTEAESAIPDVKITILVQRPERDSTPAFLEELPPGLLSSRSRPSSSAFLRSEISTSHDRLRRRSMPITVTATDSCRTVDALTMTNGAEKNSSEMRTEPVLCPKDVGRVKENESSSSRNSRTNHFRITSAGYDSRYAGGTGQLSAAKRLASAKSALRTVVVVRKDRHFNDDVTQQQADRISGGFDGGSAKLKCNETDENPVRMSIAKCTAWLNDGFEVSCFDRITAEPTV